MIMKTANIILKNIQRQLYSISEILFNFEFPNNAAEFQHKSNYNSKNDNNSNNNRSNHPPSISAGYQNVCENLEPIISRMPSVPNVGINNNNANSNNGSHSKMSK